MNLTEKEKLLLKIIWQLTEPYGNPIQAEYEKNYGQISFGRLYRMLDKLEDAGYVTSMQYPGGIARNGKPKRVFRLTGHGLALL